MEVLSLAWRTDLALLARAGSRVVHHPTMVVVTTPDDPGLHGGNLVLLRRTPLRRDLDAVLARVDSLLPGATHRVVGVDDPEGRREDLAPLAEAGMRVTVDEVLSADAVAPPSRTHSSVQVRPVPGPEAWREVVDEGAAAWFGAFAGDRLVATQGVVRAGDGLARLQAAETHPDARGHGLAGALLHAVAEHAFAAMGVRRLVVVADPDHPALALYRAAGFTTVERQLSSHSLKACES